MRSDTLDVSAFIERQKLSGFLIGLVVLSWIVTFFDGYDVNVIGFAAPYFAKDFGLTKVMIGNVFSVGLFGLLVGGFLFGHLGDRIGRRPSIILTTFLFGLFTLLIAFAQSYATLLFFRFLLGIAAGGLLPLSWALNIEYAPRRYRATIVTLVMIGYSVGTAIGGPMANWLIPAYGWRSVFVFGGALSLLASTALYVMLPESIRYLAAQKRGAADIARLLRRISPSVSIPEGAQFIVADEDGHSRSFAPALLFGGELLWITPLFWVAYIFSSMTAFFLATWTPLVFEALHFSRTDAAWAGTAASAAGALGGLLLMRFTDTRGAIAVAVMPLLAIPLLLVTGFFDFGYSGTFVAIALIAATLIGGHIGMHSLAGMFYPTAWRANGAGWATSVAKIGSIAGPWIGGAILSTSLPVRNIFAILAICPAVWLVCIFVIGRIHSRMLRAEARIEAWNASTQVEASR